MSREIRRVPSDWQHPRDSNGYKPLYDRSYETALQEWVKYEEEDPKPDPNYYRPKWEEEPTHHQIYEGVTEGTPVSPVFASQDEMKDWLLSEGFSEHASSKFIEIGWAPSMVFSRNKGLSGPGIHSLDH